MLKGFKGGCLMLQNKNPLSLSLFIVPNSKKFFLFLPLSHLWCYSQILFFCFSFPVSLHLTRTFSFSYFLPLSFYTSSLSLSLSLSLSHANAHSFFHPDSWKLLTIVTLCCAVKLLTHLSFNVTFSKVKVVVRPLKKFFSVIEHRFR